MQFFSSLLGATVSVPTSRFSVLEGDEGDTVPVDVCIRLDDIQSGLLRQVEFFVTVDLRNAGRMIHAVDVVFMHERIHHVW